MRRSRSYSFIVIPMCIAVTVLAGCAGTHATSDRRTTHVRMPTDTAMVGRSGQRPTHDSRFIPVADKSRRDVATARVRRIQTPTTGAGYTVHNGTAGVLPCLCGLDTEGQDFCFQDQFCDVLQACTSSTGCGPGERCLATNCCLPPYDFACFSICNEACIGGSVCGTYQACTLTLPHDDCGGCIPVATNQPYNNSTVGATGTDITSCTNTDTTDVWHCWQADCTGAATFSLCGSLFDTSLAIFNDCGGQELACNDDTCGTQSEITYNVTAGTTYFIRVAGYLGATGDYWMNITCNTSIGACCDNNTGVCNDRTASGNCLPPMRFAADTLCSEMVPLCGVPLTEACCFPDGICQDYSHDECLERLGVPQGPDTNCNTTICDPLGACCYQGVCEGVMSKVRCLEGGGSWSEGLDCKTVRCPTCSDGIQNQNEDRIDCGGPCVACECLTDAACDDLLYCNGQETCNDRGICQAGTPIFCGDNISCTDDLCDEVNDTCVNRPNDANCTDNLYCNGTEFCDPASDCLSTGDPCLAGTVCNEQNDICETLGACCMGDNSCIDTTRADCLAAGGTSQGLGTVCANLTCAPPAVEHDLFERTTALLQLVGGPIGPVPVPYVLRGPAQVDVYFEGPNEGNANDNDGDSLDEVPTELISLQMTDGTITLSLQPSRPSLGEIEEQINNTPGTLDVQPFTAAGSANSFFDVFFQVEVGGLILHNEQSLRLEAVIHHKPPFTQYIHIIPPNGPVELADANNQPTGIFIVKAQHYTGALEIDVFPFSIGTMELIDPSGGVETISMAGEATAHVFFEGGVEGSAMDDNGNGRDEVNTEMVELNLHGNSPSLGDVMISVHPTLASRGQIEELLNNNPGLLDVDPFAPGDANSFFDLYFQVDLPGPGLRLFTIHPKRMSSLIDHKPPGPGALYESPDMIQLYDENGKPTGYFIGATRHRPRPIIEVDQFDFSIGQFDLAFPDGSLKTISVGGPATVNVYFEGLNEGDANDDDGDGRDDVLTEMVALNLVGHHPELGVVTVSVHPTIPSLGEIEELINNNSGLLDVDPFAPGDADSFFDLFFKVTVLGQTYYTIDPKRMSSRIGEKPPGPGALYEGLVDVQLYDENGNATGIILTAARHRPHPIIEVDQFDFSIGVMELIHPSGATELIAMAGEATAHVFFEGGVEGSANDDNGNGQEEVNTEMVALDLHGTSPSLGDIIVSVHPTIPSRGLIEEQINNTSNTLDVQPFTGSGTANSYFDLFFQVDIPVLGIRLFTIQPKRMSSIIDHKPPGPGAVYENLQDIQLFNENGEPAGYFLGATRLRPTSSCDAGDSDEDGDTDQVDYISFHGCLTGPANGSTRDECRQCFDFDHDNDIDLFDVSVFQRTFTGTR